MSTMLYAPGIRAFIATPKGTIEVSDDISSGSLELGLGDPGDGHKLTLVLANQARKYDGVFTPNDRIVVFLKRVRWLQCFAGYLDSVPVFNAYAKDVKLAASCTLKRLLYTLYDEGSVAFSNLINSIAFSGRGTVDSGMGEKIVDVLTQIGNWDRDKIHIGGIPDDWFANLSGLYESIRPGLIPAGSSASLISGTSPLADGFVAYPPGLGPGIGTLPSTSGRVGAIGDNGDPLPANFSLTGESASSPNNIWYAVMRWPYQVENGSAGLNFSQIAAAEDWWRRQLIMVMNPKTQKTIIVRPAHWGPSVSSGRVIDLSREALAELGVSSGEFVQMSFAPSAPVPPLGVYVPKPSAAPSPTLNISQAIPSAIDRLTNPTRTTEIGDQPVLGEDGVVFASRDNLKPNTAAAMDFINRYWTVPNIGGWRLAGSVPNSDHPMGLALDVSTGNGNEEPNAQQVALGNSVAYWFTQNPDVFGVRVVIWNNMIYSRSGAARYIHPDDPNATDLGLSHRNHVHISFLDTGQTSLGPTGNAFPVGIGDFMRVSAVGGIITTDRATSIETPTNATTGLGGASTGPLIRTTITATQTIESQMLTGPRQLLNDKPLKPLINQMMSTAQRHYCAAPNGDLIAWWPDYFNLYGTCGRLVLQSIELDGFNVQWSDRNLVTHQFVVGSTPLGEFQGLVQPEQEFTQRKLFTHGIASIDFPEILRAVLNIDSPTSAWADPEAIYQRFGARVNAKNYSWISTPEAEFWAAISLFRMSWASQFSSQFNIGFMPELFPGMILQIPEYGVQFYCDRVVHTWALGPDSDGFSTQVNVVAPSTIGDRPSLIGLPKGGRWVGSEQETDVTLAGPRQ